MADIKVRLKDGSENVLHPETDWSVVLNKPSIKVENNQESWEPKNGLSEKSINISGNAVSLTSGTINLYSTYNGIKVKDVYTDFKVVDLQEYPVKFSTLKGAPVASDTIYSYTLTSGNIVLKTILINVQTSSVSGTTSNAFYLNASGNWSSAPSGWISNARPAYVQK